MAPQGNTEQTDSTEAKIKEAARKVFTEKGFAATRTRDIAEASGYNLALINYYFRSKEKLFDIIMLEQLQLFVHSVTDIVNNQNTSLEQKIEVLASHYIDMLVANPGLPFFIMNEINRDPRKLATKIGADKRHSPPYIVIQWNEMAGAGDPSRALHLFINLIAMTVFPFIASPMLRNRTGMTTDDFNKMMKERKKMIPVWMKMMIKEAINEKSSVPAEKSSKKKNEKN